MNTIDKIDKELETLEIRLLLDAIHERYGFDFRDYAHASLRRRIWTVVHKENLETISALQERILHEPGCMERFLTRLTVNVTSLFRDPSFYLVLREKVIPILRTYPFVRIWLAECSTGEEAYSMAILLQEEEIYDRCRIYATDMNPAVLKHAKDGIYPLASMREYSDNYLKAGGKASLSEYFTADYDSVIFSGLLKRNMIFAQHNLVTDRCFNEFNLILCRNVMIYFNQELQVRVFDLLHESLSVFGTLALGNRESLRFSERESSYEELDSRERVYRRVA